MVALALLAGPVAVAALLLWLRSRSRPDGPGAPAARVDRGVALVLAAVTVLFVAGWPTPWVRSWVGYINPDQCLGKPDASPRTPADPIDFDALKAEVRGQARDAGARAPIAAVRTTQLGAVTGPDSPGRTDERWAVGGTDLGHPFVLDGRLGLVFGDTFARPQPSGPGWRSNVLGWVDDPTDQALTITQMPQAGPGRAAEVLGSLKIDGWERTAIPTDAVAIDDRILMHYMSIACWGVNGSWAVGHSGLAVSDDGGRSFDRVLGVRWGQGSNFAQVGFVVEGDHLYAFGIPEGRDGGTRLARVSTNDVLHAAAWRYWDGTAWAPDEAAAAELVAPPVGELSVAWNDRYELWLMLYLDEGRGGIVLRTADALTGPWSRARLVASAVEFPRLYAPYLLPGTGTDEVVRFTMSRYDIYNVVLMEARLEPAEPTGTRAS